MKLFEGYESLDLPSRLERYDQIRTVEVLTEFLTYPIIVDECFNYFCCKIRRVDLLECFLPYVNIATFFLEESEGRYNLLDLVVDGVIDVLTFLLNHELPVDIVDSCGETMLFEACSYEKIDVIDLLIKRGANVNHRNTDGETVLFTAVVMAEDVRLIDRLIIAGIDLDVVNNNGDNIWKSAIYYGAEEIVMRLIQMKNPKTFNDLLEIVGSEVVNGSVPVEIEFLEDLYKEAFN